jgi:hypothetical protein
MEFYKLHTLTAVILKLPTNFLHIVRSVHSITKEQHSNSKTQNVLPWIFSQHHIVYFYTFQFTSQHCRGTNIK